MSFLSMITNSLKAVRTGTNFQQWYSKETWRPGDLAVINSSFLKRKNGKTSKSGRYAAYRVAVNGTLKAQAEIVDLPSFNREFKHVTANDAQASVALTQVVVDAELDRMGDLAFALVGQISSVDTSVVLNGIPQLTTLIWRPSAAQDLEVDGTDVVVRQPFDPRGLWALLHSAAPMLNVDSHLPRFIEALRQVQADGAASLQVPTRGSRPTKRDNFLGAIESALNQQLAEYRIARATGSQTDVLRLAYNFTSDALRVLQLLLALNDLKPAIQWATADRHLRLSTALGALPWLQTGYKPSLADYITAVHDARNRSFHNALPFQQTLIAHLGDVKLSGAAVHFVLPHSRRKGSGLTFDDYELVRVMQDFTRAHRTDIDDVFWTRNEAVLQALIGVISRTEAVLRVARGEMKQ